MPDGFAHSGNRSCSHAAGAHVVHGERADNVKALVVIGPGTELQAVFGNFASFLSTNLERDGRVLREIASVEGGHALNRVVVIRAAFGDAHIVKEDAQAEPVNLVQGSSLGHQVDGLPGRDAELLQSDGFVP